MKVETITVQNFKLFKDCASVSFKNKTLDEVSDRFLVLGDNGSGKTTLLQAIALPLALATRQIDNIAQFDWTGFLAARYARWGNPRIEVVVSFTSEEVEATRETAIRLNKSEGHLDPAPIVPAGGSATERLILDGTRFGTGELFCGRELFWGRFQAGQLLETDPSARELFPRLPGLVWFDQYRNVASDRHYEVGGNGNEGFGGRISYDVGVAKLRRHLNGWYLAQKSRNAPNRIDYLANLEALYKRVFPTRSFAGVEPMPGTDSPTPEDFFFLLNDGKRDYDIVEMSAGEQAVFPILYEFAREAIAYSVVLIDEIDLNLHPPAAQLLVSQLPKIGPTCQFIFTTHSEAVSNVVGQDDTYRLPGGALCL